MTANGELGGAAERVMELSGADRHLARNVTHCLTTSQLDIQDKAGLIVHLRVMWAECKEIWEEGCCDSCLRALELMGAEGPDIRRGK